MKLRKVLFVIFYILCLAALGGCGYVSYLSYSGGIPVRLGFLIFMPAWIIAYWFATFFYMAAAPKINGKRIYAVSKRLLTILNGIQNFFSLTLLGYWIYVYVKQYIMYKNN